MSIFDFSDLLIHYFGFEDSILVLIIPIPGHCLLFTLNVGVTLFRY